ncbi:hypothetical protein JCM16814_20470 [Desulfobaculum senezii]
MRIVLRRLKGVALKNPMCGHDACHRNKRGGTPDGFRGMRWNVGRGCGAEALRWAVGWRGT